MQGFPAPVLSFAATAVVANISSIITFNNNSTELEISALNAPAAIKWIGIGAVQTSVIASVATGNNFDHVIPSGTKGRFVIPRETQGIAGPALANSVHGLYQRLAVVTIGATVASILVNEY